ncbi:MAG: translation initiation factor IF-2 [bacterium]
MRVYELAKELGLDSSKLIALLQDEFDLEIKNHMSGIDEDVVAMVREYLEEDSEEEAAETPKKEQMDEKKSPEAETAEPEEETETTETPETEGLITIKGEITTEELADKLDIPANEAIKTLMDEGIMATINQRLDEEAIELLALQYDHEVEFEEAEEEELSWRRELELDLDVPEEELQSRPPVITVMGHVDHGKTQLLDTIRETDVVSGESGGITQHIGAYRVNTGQEDLVFIDTPGHEAFTAMRARGAQVTDLVILVVAADDGVMPRTVESINHARDAEVPIVVAINKMDLPAADAQRVKQQLTEHDLIPEEWGGDTICVEVSALQGEGIEELLEMVDLQSEMMELKTSPEQPVKGTIIESEMKEGMGATATVLVQQGTLQRGDPFVAGATSGNVRAMIDSRGDRVQEVEPGTPVEVLGFNKLPAPGDFFEGKETEAEAREIAEKRQEELRESQLQDDRGKVTMDQLQQFIDEGKVKSLNIVVKADAEGSVEVLRDSFESLSGEDVEAQVIHAGVGGINESDVMLADASDGIIIGFRVRPDSRARSLAQEKGVEIETYSVIYEAIEDVKAALTGMLDKEFEEVVIGQVEVREVFTISGVGTVAGCYVTEGEVQRTANCRLVRQGVVVFDGPLESLKRFKEDVSDVQEGYECGIGLQDFNDIKEGDIMEIYEEREVTPTLS